jgi:hypothetical protein
MTKLTDYALIGSSLFTAGAASASWASVRQGKKGARERQQPALLGAVTQLEGPGAGEKTPTFLNILNAGGLAKNVACLLAIEDHYIANPAGPGFLRNQQEAAIATELPPSSDRRAILMCRDLRQRVWACDLDRNLRSYDGREADPALDFEAFWLDFYGEDLSLLTRVGSKVAVEAMTAGENHTS